MQVNGITPITAMSNIPSCGEKKMPFFIYEAVNRRIAIGISFFHHREDTSLGLLLHYRLQQSGCSFQAVGVSSELPVLTKACRCWRHSGHYMAN